MAGPMEQFWKSHGVNNYAGGEVKKKKKEQIKPAGTSMADFRQLDQKSSKQPAPKAKSFSNFVAQGNPDFVADHPTLSKALAAPGYALQSIGDLLPEPVQDWVGRAGQTGGEVMTLTDNPNKVSTGSGAGDITADLWGGVMGFIGNPTPGGVESAGAKLWQGAESAIGKALPSIIPKSPKLAQEAIKVGGATIPYELTNAYVNDRSVSPEEAGLAVGANIALPLLTRGIGKLGEIKKTKIPASEEIPSTDSLFGEVAPKVDTGEYSIKYPPRQRLALPEGQTEIPQSNIPNWEYWQEPALRQPVDFAVGPLGRTYIGEPQLELPAGKEPAALTGRTEQQALPSAGEQAALPPGVNWEYYKAPEPIEVTGTVPDFYADSHTVMDKNASGVPATIEGQSYEPNTGLNNKQRFYSDTDKTIPRSDIGDPTYLKQAESKYNELIDNEIKNLKSQVQGVETVGTNPYQMSNGQLLFDGYNRVSLNPKWYRDFYAQNGRPPREGEYRDMAIQNLIRGNAETGEPANNEFLGILSELSRGQKLPEEWHGLQKSIRDTAAMNEPELQPLIGEMQTAQKQAEPYGLTRDMGRLNEVENATRNRTGMIDLGDFGQYQNVRFKKETPPPEIQAKLDEASYITGYKTKWAPQALEKKPFQMANELVKTITGKEAIPYVSSEKGHGYVIGDQVYLNARSRQPMVYVTSHEITHTMETTHPEYYGQLKQIALEHVADTEGINNHYIKKYGYEPNEVPNELTADVLAECMVQPTFWQRVREQAPGLLKPILDAIDRILSIAKEQAKVPGKYEIMGYMKDVETMRDRIAAVYKEYLNEVQSGKAGQLVGQESVAAKAKGETVESTQTPEFKQWFGDSKVVDEQGRPLVVHHITDKSNKFNVFRPNYEHEMGMHFGTEDTVKNYATMITNELNPNKAIKKVRDIETYLSIKNPIYMNDVFGGNPHNVIRELQNEGALDSKDFNTIRNTALKLAEKDGIDIDLYDLHDLDTDKYIYEAIKRRLVKKGYDGIVYENINEGGGNSYIAFDPAQIKSVYNRGTWDAANPDIRYKLGQEQSYADDFRDMILAGARQLPKSMGFTDNFKAQILKQFPQVADEPQADAILKFVYDRASELRKGQTAFSYQGQTVNLSKKDMVNSNPINTTTGQPGTNPQDWNHIASKTERVWPGLKQGAKSLGNTLYRGGFDDLNRLNQLDNMQKKKTGKGFNADEKAYILALNSRESGGTAKAILTDALYDSQGNRIGDSLASITKQVPKGTEQDFSNYLVYRHAPSWLEQGRQVFPEDEGITADVARQRAADYEQAHPEFKQLADNLIQWQRDFGKAWLVDTGIIKPETWDMFQQIYPDYIPLQRKMEDIEKGGIGVKRGYANQSNPIKKAEGSQRQIIDPIESIIEQVDKYVKVARRNEVMQTIIKNIEQTPEDYKDWIEVIPEDNQITSQSLDDTLLQDGIDGVMDTLDQPFQAAYEGKKLRLDRPNVVTGIVNGEKVHVKVNDPALLDALAKLTPQASLKLVEMVRQVTRTMKVLTTGANVFFASRNIVRDLPMSYINSKTTNNPVRWAWDIVDSMARVATNGKYDPGSFYQTYKALGGGSHSSSIAADRNLLAESKASVMPGYYDKSKPLTAAGRGLKAGARGIEAFTNAVETIPRLPEYIRTAKAGGDTYGARQAGLHAAQDVTVNFSRRGTLAKDADAFVPYLNASLQGMDKLVRSYKDNPTATVAKSILAITVPTIGIYLANRDNPKYKQLSSYIRDNYFCIPIDGGKKFLKIAKPREAGTVFSSLVERCLTKWADDDPNGFKGFSEAWINNFVPPIRSIAAPLSDIRSNKNFADIPIVPGYMENLSPELQYDENTSAPAKAIGEAFNVSPKQVDYLTRSYTGFLGEFGIPAASEGKGESIGQRLGNVMKKTYVADPLYSNDILSQFYDTKAKLDTSNSDAKYLGKQKPSPEKATMFNQAASDIGDISKQIRAINRNKSINPEEKQKQTAELRQQMLDIAQQALKGKYQRTYEGIDWENLTPADSVSSFFEEHTPAQQDPTDVISEAMQMAGVDDSWRPYLNVLMSRESGGNPGAMNPTAVRTRYGNEHATGLFQTLPSTFAAHAAAGYTDITAPLDNTLAAIDYIAGRYGHPANIPNLTGNNYKGY